MPTNTRFQFWFADDSIAEFVTGVIPDQWVNYVMSKNDAGAKCYVDGALVGTIPFIAGQPTEWVIQQSGGDAGFPYTLPMTFGANVSPYAMGDMDQVLIFDQELTPGQISAMIEKSVLYKIDGIPFEDYQVYVDDSEGVVDVVKMKDPLTLDWAGEHGLIVDLERPRFQEREIELSCWVKSNGKLDFTMKMNEFLGLFLTPHTHRLKIEINTMKPLLYEVYMPEGVSIDKMWRDQEMFGRFKLQFKSPYPVRRVLRFLPTFANNYTAKIRFTCPEAVDIFWGDGTRTNDILAGDDLLITHEYTLNKPFFEILICGEVTNITNFSHNTIMVWSRL
jgi:hypothetical protein